MAKRERRKKKTKKKWVRKSRGKMHLPCATWVGREVWSRGVKLSQDMREERWYFLFAFLFLSV